MNKCYLSLGSNQKNPEKQIRQALKALKGLPATSLTQASSLHWTKAWGLKNQPDFCNAVVELITTLSPTKLLSHCQAIEKKQGRVRKKRWGPRTLDIDILFYGNRTIKTRRLTIPHPYMYVRAFVLVPLREILDNQSILATTPDLRSLPFKKSP